MLFASRSPSTKRSQIGQGIVEYALFLALIAIVVFAALSLLGPAIGNSFSTIGDGLPGP